jgi:hypothetical protein
MNKFITFPWLRVFIKKPPKNNNNKKTETIMIATSFK